MWENIKAGKSWTADIQNKKKTGEPYFVRSVISPLKNIDGNVEQFMAVRFDITEQKTNDIEREKLANFLEVVLDNIPSMIFVKDPKKDFKISMLNKAGQALLGNRKDLLSKLGDQEIFKTKKTLKIEKDEIVTPDGKRIFQTHKVPTFHSNGEPHLLIGISNDITGECKMKEDLELERSKSLKNAKLASLGEMSAGIAHEINNPLAIISGSVGLLEKFANNPEKRSLKIESIKKSCERITRIVTGLRKFSRTGGKPDFKNHELLKIVKEALVLTESKSTRENTPISINSEGDSWIYCDEVEIEQVLVNFINNAIDAVKTNKEKWVSIDIKSSDSFVILRVIDSGRGIPEHVRNKLFEPFFTTKRIGEGTGLGLSISKGILDEHKASISVLPEHPNTCFEIRFPMVTRDKNAA